jgi:hypothetical protein
MIFVLCLGAVVLRDSKKVMTRDKLQKYANYSNTLIMAINSVKTKGNELNVYEI